MPHPGDQTGGRPDPIEDGSVSGPNDLRFGNAPATDEDIEERLRELDYTLTVRPLDLPSRSVPDSGIEDHVRSVPGHVDLSEPEAVREFIALPLLYAAARSAEAKIERFADVGSGEKLQALLDYRVLGNRGRLVVETRHRDLERGALRLAGQLMVIDQGDLDAGSADPRPLFGAIAAGGAWRFLALHKDRQISQDLNLYGAPPDVREVVERLAGTLGGAVKG